MRTYHVVLIEDDNEQAASIGRILQFEENIEFHIVIRSQQQKHCKDQWLTDLRNIQPRPDLILMDNDILGEPMGKTMDRQLGNDEVLSGIKRAFLTRYDGDLKDYACEHNIPLISIDHPRDLGVTIRELLRAPKP